jgi:phosphoribosyl-ATP pyrophosphohydrolase
MFNWVSNLLPSYQEGHTCPIGNTGPICPTFTTWNNVSNFQKVLDFNTQFGVVQNKTLTPNPTIFDTDPQKVEFCLKLIREEAKETEEAVKNKDFVETVDGLVDQLYVIYGMLARIGVDADKAFDLVHENNMSKLCKTEEEAQRSVKYYVDASALGYDSPCYRKAPDDVHWVVYNRSTNKILKSIEWKPVDLTPVLS